MEKLEMVKMLNVSKGINSRETVKNYFTQNINIKKHHT